MRVEPYEKVWMALSAVMLLGFLGAISVSVFVHGISLPGATPRLDPRTVPQEPHFASPGIYQTAPGEYEVYLVSMLWSFVPNEIRVPAGARVTFYAISQDVTHGLAIHGTNLNLMLIPGLVGTGTAKFDKPGEYLFICHEYCGLAHQTMAGKVIVEAKP
ncbi:MAG: cytochrome c oxidase subunit II [Deltaproteobacteria bacterium]|nr:cytochrome c oxidase subunit II [Deltaproteobacteria bacterium]